jgi:hypothetical protein
LRRERRRDEKTYLHMKDKKREENELRREEKEKKGC